jgi:thioredoxin reductase (NADPH)
MIGVVAGGLAAGAVYGLARLLFGGAAAVVAGLLCALWPGGIAVASVTGTDMPSAALIVIAVWLLVRGPGLEASMSRYLIDRIAAQPNVEVLTQTEVSALEGRGGVLEAIRWRQRPSGREVRQPIRHLFLFIGAEPNTEWLLQYGVALDDKGFVRTDANLGSGGRPLETSRPGVFAIGDVRSGSVKRVGGAIRS